MSPSHRPATIFTSVMVTSVPGSLAPPPAAQAVRTIATTPQTPCSHPLCRRSMSASRRDPSIGPRTFVHRTKGHLPPRSGRCHRYTERPMSETRRVWRYVAYTTGALALLVVLLAIGSWLAARAWGPLLARDRVETALTAALGRPVHVGDVAIEAWRGRLVISAVTADALPGEPGPHFLTLGRADVQIGVSSLWRRRLVDRKSVV